MAYQKNVGLGLVALGFLISVGCGGNATTPDSHGGGGTGGLGGNASCTPNLEIVGSPVVHVAYGTTSELVAQFTCGDSALPNAKVQFSVTGTANDSKLVATSATTDKDGQVSLGLVAGNDGATFKVTATVEGKSVVWDVTVDAIGAGTLIVSKSYDGKASLNGLSTLLFEGVACADVDPFAPPTAKQSAKTTKVADKDTFGDVAPGKDYTVVVEASVGSQLTAFGCKEGIESVAGKNTDVTIALSDLPKKFDGVYHLDTYLDLADKFPDAVKIPLHVLDELTDDKDVTGTNCGTVPHNTCGQDPAAFFADILARQLCAWECTPGQTYDACTPANHPYGDLQGAYTHKPLASWSSAVSRFNVLGFGGCTVADLLVTTGQAPLNTLIDKNVPGIALALTNIGGDLSRILTKLHLKSDLSVTNVSVGKDGTFSHTLKNMVVSLHDLSNKPVEREFPLDTTGIITKAATGTATSPTEGQLKLADQSYTLAVGKVVSYVYHNVLLSPDGNGVLPYKNTADLLGHILDCSKVGDWISSTLNITIPPVVDTASLCTMGLQLAANELDKQLDSAISTTATLQYNSGAATGSALSPKLVYTKLDNGTCQGGWVEVTSPQLFPGTFTGTQQ